MDEIRSTLLAVARLVEAQTLMAEAGRLLTSQKPRFAVQSASEYCENAQSASLREVQRLLTPTALTTLKATARQVRDELSSLDIVMDEARRNTLAELLHDAQRNCPTED